MLATLAALRKKVVTGIVGGSDFVKIAEQFAVPNSGKTGASLCDVMPAASAYECARSVVDYFDYTFGENGLTAYKLGKPLPSEAFIKYVGEERYKVLVNFILHYLADIDIPIKRCVPACCIPRAQ